jgi:NAD(P)-dependent dehydrogenase (short-subunit alcohol dehydrogenase family)
MPSFVVVGASRGLGVSIPYPLASSSDSPSKTNLNISSKYAWLQYLSKDPANTVIGLARTPAPVEDLLSKDGISNVHILPGDMASHSSVATAASLATPLLPSGLDVLIINGAYNQAATGFLPPTAFSSASQASVLNDEMHTSLDVNVLGVVYSVNEFLPLVLKGSVKKVVVISTGLADPDAARPADKKNGNPMMVVYAAMKAALNMVVAKYAAELKPKGVMTLALSPGLVDTNSTKSRESYLLFPFSFTGYVAVDEDG